MNVGAAVQLLEKMIICKGERARTDGFYTAVNSWEAAPV
jgi:hypothetical protein